MGSVSMATCLPCAVHAYSGDHGMFDQSPNVLSTHLGAAKQAANAYSWKQQDTSDVPDQVKLGCAAAVAAASGLVDLLLQASDNCAHAAEAAVGECEALLEAAPDLSRRPATVADRLTSARADAADSLARLRGLRARADAALAGLTAAVAAAFACDAEVACRRGAEQLAAADAAFAELDARLAGIQRRLTGASVAEIRASEVEGDA